MPISTWNLLGLIAIILFVAIFIIMMIRGDLRDKLYHTYHEDEIVKITKDPNSINTLCFTSGEASKFIKKYVICKTNSDRYILCNYTKEFNKILFYVVCYSKRKKVVGILRYTERKTTKTSRIIVLPRKARYVNIVIGRVEDRLINKHIAKPLLRKQAHVHALLSGLLTLTGLFAGNYIIASLLAGSLHLKNYLNSDLNLIFMILMAVLSILVYILNLVTLLSKSKKSLSGGALEYEFI